MAENVAALKEWRIEYTGEPEAAAEIAVAFGKANVPVSTPEPKSVEARLGTPEVILTIIATAALKATIKAGLDALKQYLELRAGANDGKRIQVIVQRPNDSTKRFGLSLKNLGLETITEFITDISAVVEHI